MKKYLLLLLFVFTLHPSLHAQYAENHYIAPAPWQYWSTANEAVIGTLSETPVSVVLRKSDGTILTTTPLTVTVDNPISYRFTGGHAGLNANQINQVYSDRGLIVEATAPVLVNMRNIASDASGATQTTIKGNASLVSFGNEGRGRSFRVGYYRSNYTGLVQLNPVYSIMAIEDDTSVTGIPNQNITLNAGESYLFFAPMGTLITTDKDVVMNTGNWGDTPMTSGSNGQDGTFDQIAPIHVLGSKYLVVRGTGDNITQTHITQGVGGEQTTFISTEDNTIVTVDNFTPAGTFVSQQTYTLSNAGDFEPFYHGDTNLAYSSSLITSDKPIIVYSGIADGPETDISTVLPIGGCAGITNIQTKKFINFSSGDMPYFGFSIIESDTDLVYINGNDMEVETGINRIPLGTTGFYMLTFTNENLSDPDNIIITSSKPLTTSLVQSGGGFSMSAFFSAFGQAAFTPVILTVNENCTVRIQGQQDDDILQYEWLKDGQPIAMTEESVFDVIEPGNYSVRIRKDCGWSNISLSVFVDVDPCNDLSITKEIVTQSDEQAVFQIIATNNDLLFTDPNVVVTDLLPSGYQYIVHGVSQGIYDVLTGQWNVGALAPQLSAELYIVVTLNDSGNFLNVATITGENMDNNMDNNRDDAIVEFGKFTFTKKALSTEFYQVGEVVEYEIVVTNTGSYTLRNIRVTDENADLGSVVPEVVSNLPAGESAVFSAKHTITIQDFKNGFVSNQASVALDAPTGTMNKISDNPDTPEADDPTIVDITRIADMHADKDDFKQYFSPGDITEYTIVVRNNGPSSLVDLVVEDPMPLGVTEMSWQSTRNTSGTGNLLDVIPLLNVGENVTYKVVLKIPETQKGDFVNTVFLKSEYNDVDPVEECLECIDINWHTIEIPKGISPNGDGLNDYLELSHFRIKEVKIFNRYGKMVFTKKDYNNEWYGQDNSNVLLPDGTYFYHILSEDDKVFTGYIQLVKESK